MPSSVHSNSPPGPIDLERVTEATRRSVYDAVVGVHFPSSDEADAGDWVPPYSPDDADLTIIYLAGRWLATWEMVEERDNHDLPPDRKHELVCITASPEAPYGLSFSEV